MATLVCACCVGPETLGWPTRGPLQWWPLATVGLVQIALAMLRTSSFRCLAGGSALVAASAIAFRGTSYLALGGAVPLHLLVACIMLIGFVYRDPLARYLAGVGAILVAVAALTACLPQFTADVPSWARLGYVGLLAVASFGYWYVIQHRWWLWAALINTGTSMAAVCRVSYGIVQNEVGPAAMAPLAGGVVCFVIAVAISAGKGGLWKRLRSRLPPGIAARI
jgi:hypothetical protein